MNKKIILCGIFAIIFFSYCNIQTQTAHISTTQNIDFARSTTTLLQEYAHKLNQEIILRENEYNTQKGIFNFIWEPKEQKNRRHKIAALKKELQEIQENIKNVHVISTNAIINIYHTMLTRIATFTMQQKNQQNGISIAVLTHAIQNRLNALEHMI